MKKKITTLLAAIGLLTMPFAAWAGHSITYWEPSFAFQENGEYVDITIQVYDFDGYDQWMADGWLHVSINGGAEKTLFYIDSWYDAGGGTAHTLKDGDVSFIENTSSGDSHYKRFRWKFNSPGATLKFRMEEENGEWGASSNYYVKYSEDAGTFGPWNIMHPMKANSYAFKSDGSIDFSCNIPGYNAAKDKGTVAREFGGVNAQNGVYLSKSSAGTGNYTNGHTGYNSESSFTLTAPAANVEDLNSDHTYYPVAWRNDTYGTLTKVGTGIKIPPYPQPRGLNVIEEPKDSATKAYLTFTWSAAEGNSNSPTDKFVLGWRRSGSSDAYQTYSTTPWAGSLDYQGPNPDLDNLNYYSVTFPYPEVGDDYQYEFAIKRANLNWNINAAAYTQEKKFPTLKTSYPSVDSVGVTADSATGSARVHWFIGHGKIKNGLQYRIFRREGDNSAYSSEPVGYVNYSFTSKAEADKLVSKKRWEWEDADLASCVPYYYKVELWTGASADAKMVASKELKKPVVRPANGTWLINTFSVSKGYYNDRVTLSWEVPNGSGFSNYSITRTPLEVDNANEDYIYSTKHEAGQNRYFYTDDKASLGVYYTYKLMAQVTCLEQTVTKGGAQSVGFIQPLGVVSGKIDYEGGSAVEGVQVVVTTDETSFANKAAHFDRAKNTHIEIPYKSGTLNPEAFTFQAWVNEKVGSSGIHALMDAAGKYDVELDNDTVFLSVYNGTDADYTDYKFDTLVQRGKFTHITITYEAKNSKGTATLYLNGVPADTVVKDLAVTPGFPNTSDADKRIYLGRYWEDGSYFDGYIDELRLWKRVLTPKEIAQNFDCYITGRESGLSLYYRFDEMAGCAQVFDMSGANQVFNENHGNIKGSTIDIRTTTVVPTPSQLSIKGVTDVNGNYLISTIPYTSDGLQYTLTPIKGVHKFSPDNRNLFFNPNSSNHNNIDFVDKSSFKVRGTVYYDGGNYPVEGCTFTVDASPVTRNNELVMSDAKGEYEIDVPIGVHTVKVNKLGHTFLQGGLALQNGQDINYMDDITGMNFRDITRVKLIGYVVGGMAEANKISGFGERRNNIGSDVLQLVAAKNAMGYKLLNVGTFNATYYHNDGCWKKPDGLQQDSTQVSLNGSTYTIHVSPTTGEYVAWVYPERYTIQNIQVNGYGEIYTRLETLDLTTAPIEEKSQDMPQHERTWTTSEKVPPKDNQADSVVVTENHSDTVKYHAEWGYYYQAPPTYTVRQAKVQGSNTTPVSYFGEQTLVITDKLTDEKDTVALVNNSGTYLFGHPVFKQGQPYYFLLEAYEEYTNYKTTVVDHVPIDSGKISISSDISLAGDAEMKLDSSGKAIYRFLGGEPNFAFNNGDGGLRTMSTKITVGSISYFSNLGQAGLEAYLLGDVSAGSDFITQGPNRIITVLHDPPGSNSSAYLEKGFSTTHTTTYGGGITISASYGKSMEVGTEIEATIGVGYALKADAELTHTIEAGISTEDSWENSNTKVTTHTYTQRFSTSADPGSVGHQADLFVGYSTNVIYGVTNRLLIARKGTQAESAEKKTSSDGRYTLAQTKGFAFGENFATQFFYTVSEIENIIIPKWQETIKQLLLPYNTDTTKLRNYPRPVYISTVPESDKRYAVNDSCYYKYYPRGYVVPRDSTLVATFPVKKYEYYYKDDDSIANYLREIKEWKRYLAYNEQVKTLLAAPVMVNGEFRQNEGNYSFGGDATIDYSDSYDFSTETSNTGTWSVSPYLNNVSNTDFSASGIKLAVTIDANVSIAASGSYGESNASGDSKNVGFTLQDGNSTDQLSVDFGYASIDGVDLGTPTFIFRTKGGRTSCPFEGGQVTKYFEPDKHTLDEQTMQVEVPQLTVKGGQMRVQVPSSRAATFTFELSNVSETGDQVTYVFALDEASNPRGAVVRMDGSYLTGAGRYFSIPGGGTITKTVTIEKGPEETTYENLRFVLASACDGSIEDAKAVSVEFLPACSDIEVTAPTNNWLVNTNTGDIMEVKLENFDRNYVNFDHVELQYRNVAEPQWRTIMSFYTDSARYKTAQGLKTMVSAADANITYKWDMSQTPDGAYELRARTMCETLTGGYISECASEVKTGIKDMSQPTLFGKASPTDGVLRGTDDIMIVFNEAINQGLITKNNFTVRGVKNGSITDHNTSVHFDGLSTYMATESELNLSDESFTIEFWMKRNATGACTLLSQGSGNERLTVGFDEGDHLRVQLGSNNALVSEATITDTRQWGYYALVYDHTKPLLTVHYAVSATNLVLIDAANIAPYTGIGRLFVGCNHNLTGFASMDMHGLIVWNRALQLTTLMKNKDKIRAGNNLGMVAYWPMNEGKGTVVQDKTRSRHAILSAVSWKVLPEGKSLRFDGKNTLEIGTAASVVVGAESDFTVEFWFKSTNPNGALFSCGSGDPSSGEQRVDNKLCIYAKDGTLKFSSNGQVFTTNSVNAMDGTWRHFVLSVNRTGMANVYMNGVLIGAYDATELGGLAGTTMLIGARRWQEYDAQSAVFSGIHTDMFYTGLIDEFRIWGLAITQDYINAYGNVRLYGNDPGLLAYYPFDTYRENNNDQMELVFSKEDQRQDTSAGTSELNASESDDIAPIKDAGPIVDYEFDVVTANDRIILNLTDNIDAIEHTQIVITAKEIQDMHGNEMASAHQWYAYIDRAMLKWTQATVAKTKRNNVPLSFPVQITNKSGQAQNFTVENIPSWLTVSPASGTAGPEATIDLTFTVDNGLNPGSYEAVLNLHGEYSNLMVLNLNVGGEKPDWSIDARKYDNSMVLFGQLKLNEAISTDETDLVAAFVNGECVGVNSPIYTKDKWLVTLKVYSNTPNAPVELRIWDASCGKIYTATPDDIRFVADTVLGTPAEPVIIENAGDVAAIPLEEGWNWISLNVNTAGGNLLIPNLANIANGYELKAQNGTFIRYEGGTWGGTLSTYSPTQMYMFKLTGPNTLYLAGTAADVATTPITLRPGWNWLGFTPQQNMTVDEAFSNFTPRPGDVLKSQTEVAMYDARSGWVGDLQYLRPGMGYMYRASQGAEFTYPQHTSLSLYAGARAARPLSADIAPAYAGNMTLVGEVQGIALAPNALLIARAGGEQRGLALARDVDGRTLFLLPVYSNAAGERISFALYNNGEEVPLTETIPYADNAVVGFTDAPLQLTPKAAAGTTATLPNAPTQTLTAFPNPTAGQLIVDNVQCTIEDGETVEVSVYDVSGTQVLTRQLSTEAKRSSAKPIVNYQLSIDISILPAGTYIIRVGDATVKVVKR